MIHECRTSGLSDKVWCEDHRIQPSNFYYHIRRLRAKACEITEHDDTVFNQQEQAVVPLSFSESATLDDHRNSNVTNSIHSEEVLTLQMNGVQLGITNLAARETIANVLSVLQELC